MSERKKLEQVTSPEGIAQFPWLHKADTKFNPDGDYKVTLALPAKAKSTKEFIDKLDEAYGAAVERAKGEVAEKKGKAAAGKIKLADKPYRLEEDKDTGKPTGNMLVNFKLKAKVTSKKDNETYEQRPRIFDAKGKEIVVTPRIGGGSKIKVSALLVPFYTAQVGAGITLRLRAVQLIELVEFGGGNADSYGFGEEEGYEAPAEAPALKQKKGKAEDADEAAQGDEF